MDLWNRVSNIGVPEKNELNQVDIKRLIFFNQVLFIGVFATFFQIISMWEFIGEKALIYLVISVVSFISLVLNSKGYSNISKKLFMLIVYSVGSYTTVLIGGSGLYHIGAFAIFTSSLVIFDIRKEKFSILMGIPFLILTMGIGEFGWFNAPDFSDHESLQLMRFSSFLNLFVIISILMFFILRLNHKSEEKLSNRKNELEGLVQDRTEELNSQKNILEKQNKEKEILLKEVHHRVKNNLQIIVSLINLQLSKYDNDLVSEALVEIQGRVLSMSLVHQEMYQTSDFSSIDLKEYMVLLVENAKSLHNNKGVDYKLDFEEKSFCDVEKAIPIGLIFNEVVSNFFKHVSSIKSTYFSISLKSVDDNYVLIYKDNGHGFPKDYKLKDSDSLGLQLIESLTDQIDGEFEFYNDNGAVYKIKFKNK